MYLSIDAITDVSKADSLIKAQEMGLLCTKYQLSTLYYKLFLTLLTDSGKLAIKKIPPGISFFRARFLRMFLLAIQASKIIEWPD